MSPSKHPPTRDPVASTSDLHSEDEELLPFSGLTTWRVLADAVPLPVVAFDPEWRIVYVNAAGEFLTLGRTLFSYIRQRDRDWLRNLLDSQTALAGATSAVETILRLEAGRELWIVWTFLDPIERTVSAETPVYRLAIGRECSPERRIALVARAAGLTPREAEILQLTADAFSNLNIAARLGISESTVKNHMKSMFRKLGLNSRMELMTRLFGESARAAFEGGKSLGRVSG